MRTVVAAGFLAAAATAARHQQQPDAGSCAVNVQLGGSSHRIPPELNGCHYSPLDHQLYTLYSQMVPHL